MATWYDSAWIGGTASGWIFIQICGGDWTILKNYEPLWTIPASVSGWTRGVQVKLWDPLRTHAIYLQRLRGVITMRRYTNPRLPYLTDILWIRVPNANGEVLTHTWFFFTDTPMEVDFKDQLDRQHQRQVAQLSQRDRAAGWVSYGKKWKTGTARQYSRKL